MSKAKNTSPQAQTGGAPAPPVDTSIVVTAARTLDRHLPVGTIILHPTERERKLCQEGAAEPLAQWWPGLAQDEPLLADARRYPVVLLRGGAELWVRLDARTLRPLNDCSLAEATQALGRTTDAAVLEQAAQHARHPSLRQAARELAAQQAAEVRPTEPTPVALAFSGGRWATVLLDNGKEAKPDSLYLDTLLPLVATCEHVNVLTNLAQRDKRQQVKDAVAQRLAELAAPPAGNGHHRPQVEA